MAARLGNVRTQLVDRLSLEVINQILDRLFEDGVLNEGEKDGIIQANQKRSDKARDLIDIVRKKGDVASEKMLDILQDRDPMLCSSLGLQSQ
uniref:CARD domain-containing protein n=1 Tax=Sphaeramia orbicularis TaxID=375764 RepID=A0A673B6I4_9TELE